MTNWLEKWSKVHDDSVVIQEFLDFLSSEGIIMCMTNEKGIFPMMRSQQQLIYDHFKINADKLEQQRRNLLVKVQEKQNHRNVDHG